jgi:uncharacterized protein (TIGR00369 family)
MERSELRTHTFSWRDHRLTMAQARAVSGREYLEAMRAGTIAPPPFVALLGLRLEEVGDGRVVFTFTPQEYLYNGIGLIHGGVTATVFDTAVGCACLSIIQKEKIAVTIDLHVRYFKPLTMASGTVRCEGIVLNAGRTTISAEARLFDATGRLCGHATSTLALVDAPPHA